MSAGSLYQLFSSRQLPVSSYVAVNGPHDTYGIILKSEPKDGKYLNLIRGVPRRDSETPIFQF